MGGDHSIVHIPGFACGCNGMHCTSVLLTCLPVCPDVRPVCRICNLFVPCSIWLDEQEQQAAAVAAAAEALEGLDLDTLDLLSNASKQVCTSCSTQPAMSRPLASVSCPSPPPSPGAGSRGEGSLSHSLYDRTVLHIAVHFFAPSSIW